MEQIFQSAVLQSLGWAIADSIWQMALLWLVFQVVVALPFRKPAIRHLGATVALFCGGAWFIGNVIARISRASGFAVYGNGTIHPSVTTWIQALLPYLSTAYLVVLVLMLARYVFAFVSTQRLRTAEEQPGSEWQQFVDEMALRFFISRKVRLRVTEVVNVPATIGFLKPVILLPLASVNNLSVEQVEAIIMHELAHIQRHDYLVNLIASFVETILFFNPFAHLLGNQMRKDCELCCDDAVLGKQQDPGQYAYALLLLERNRQQLPLAMAATGKESFLLGRVKRILNQPEQKVKYRHKLLALMLVAVLIMGLSLLDAPAKKENRQVTSMDTVTRTYRNNENITLKELVSQPPPPPRPRLAPAAKTRKPIDIINTPEPENGPFPPGAPLPPPPAPPFMADLNEAMGPMEVPGQLLVINDLDEKRLAEVMNHFSEGKMMMELDRRMMEMDRHEAELRRIKRNEDRLIEEMHRVQENINRREKQVMIRRMQPAPHAVPDRKPLQGQRITPERHNDEEKDIIIYRSTAKANIKGSQVRTFVTEEGFTFSIVDNENSISIRFSNK